MKLNIGSGFRKMDGYVNVDNFKECEPDVLMNLEETPWQFDSNSISEITAIHVLEHLGEQRETFFNILKEIYRVLKHDGIFRISVPFYMHPTFYTDPTHVRSFTSGTFKMMSKKVNKDWMERNVNATMLAFMLDIDFETIEISYKYDSAWAKKLNDNEISKEDLLEIAQERWGVIQELNVVLKACK
ncbi:class I SAM-dependent methyltransferase [Nisaea denitrificans]|uniref:class I SAM-dependent methyltransferase n=1 Tax=Nisaea denitrificans TaxID=390877 RepID=UPI00048D13AE|nr:methyltransferase domain-containing protein [Nisaea denitrificans]